MDNAIDASFEYSRADPIKRQSEREKFIERGVDVSKIDNEQYEQMKFKLEGGGSKVNEKADKPFKEQLMEYATKELGEDTIKALGNKEQLATLKGTEMLNATYNAMESILKDSYMTWDTREKMTKEWKEVHQPLLKNVYATWAK